MDRFNLGKHTRKISTSSINAQKYFDLGLNWCFGFNHEEGAECFQQALAFDPDCALAYWGIAYAKGPFYNFPWSDFGDDEAVECTKLCFENIQTAKSLRHKCSEPEAVLIDALSYRFQKPYAVSPEEFDRWDDDYGHAMRRVYKTYPDDLDVVALFAEAVMTRTPWKLWDVATGKPADGADTLEAIGALEHAIGMADKNGVAPHPALLHLHIHATEMSNEPEQAMQSADILGSLCPDAGHMNHMPGHTYVLCGEYEKAKTASERAIAADDMYLNYAGPHNFYTTARCHDLHLMMYTCMFMGQYSPAVAAAEKMCETLTMDVLGVKGRPQLAVTMEGYFSMKMHVLVRFGRWQDIIDAAMPECPVLYCVSTAMHHYAKGVAYAALKRIDDAETQRTFFHAALTRIPENRKFFNNTASSILSIGEKMLDGELEYHKGNYQDAFVHLRESVRWDDNLAYSEPWAWMHPPRHALAALLIEQGDYEEAEEIYRTDLGLSDNLQRCAQHPGNVWALHGLVECLRNRGEVQDRPEYENQLAAAMKKADVSISSSCLCRTRC